MFKNLGFLFLFTVSIAFSGRAYSYKAPQLTGPVVDQVGLLSSRTAAELSQQLSLYQQNTSNQFQVLIIPSLEGDSIESIAIQVFDQWKLGDAKTDKGLLFLIAPNEKKLRIEVGQGLEGDIPDVIAKRIISEVVTPYFKRGEFDLGVQQGIVALQSYAAGKEDLPKQDNSSWIAIVLRGNNLVKLILFLVLIILSLFNRGGGSGLRRRGGYYGGYGGGGFGGGSFGGGSWGGGGGSSSGGGASGGW